MQGDNNYRGVYAAFGMALEVNENDGHWEAAVVGVPAGYEITLEPLGEHHFRMVNGPLQPSTMEFILAEGRVVQLRVDEFELDRYEQLEEVDYLTERLLAPPLEMTAEKEAAFAELLTQALTEASGDWLDYDLPFPKYEFLQYASAQNVVVFHGSNNREIEEFATKRTSIELKDTTGRGNLQAVYATHDGLWPMFFAIIDRPRMKGSIRNGVLYFDNDQGDRLPVYNFSINQQILPEKPYCPGALYFLPRATFRQLPMGGGALSNEWASEVPVRPLAKLALEPEDFPFLDQIGGHDDGVILTVMTLLDNILGRTQEAEKVPGGFELVLKSDELLTTEFDEFHQLAQSIVPAATFNLRIAEERVAHLSIAVPPAMEEVIAEKLPPGTLASLTSGSE